MSSSKAGHFCFRPVNSRHFAILQRLRMLRGFPAFEWWVEPPDEVFLRLYIFNITNKDAFLAGTEKLKVKEVGPWIFR